MVIRGASIAGLGLKKCFFQPIIPTLAALFLCVMIPNPSFSETTTDDNRAVSVNLTSVSLTLDDCIRMTLEKNPTLRASQYELKAAEQDVKVARADFLPSLTASGGYAYVRSVDASGSADSDYLDQQRMDAGFSVSQTLYAGKRITNTFDRAVIRTQVMSENRDDLASRLIYRLRTRFFELMKAREDVVVAVDTVKRLEAVFTTAEAFYEKEMAPYAQVLQARVDLADARQKLGIAENTVERKRSELFALMNRPYTVGVTFSGGLHHYSIPFEMDEAACIAHGISHRSDLQSLIHQLSVVEKDAAISMGKYLPMVKLTAGFYDQDRDYDYERMKDQHNTYWNAGVNLSWSLFDGGRGWYEKEKHLIEKKRIEEQIHEIRATMENGIRIALFSLSEAEERIATTFEGVSAADEYLERERQRFQAGIATIASVLDAQERVTRAKGSYAQALLDYQLVRAELDYLMGGKEG